MTTIDDAKLIPLHAIAFHFPFSHLQWRFANAYTTCSAFSTYMHVLERRIENKVKSVQLHLIVRLKETR